MDELLTPEELARYLGVSLSTLYSWSSQGEGPPKIKIGRKLRYRVADVKAWLDSKTEVEA